MMNAEDPKINMPPSPYSVTLGGRFFKSPAKVIQEAKRIIQDARLGATLQGYEAAFAADLYKLYPRPRIKNPIGFTVAVNKTRDHVSVCFFALNGGIGPNEPWSFRVAISQRIDFTAPSPSGSLATPEKEERAT